MRIPALIAALVFSAALTAQSPLTTLFASNNSGSAGGTVMFDLTVNIPVAISQIDVNTVTAALTPGTLEIRTAPTTYIGNEFNAAAWTSVSSGNPLTTAANNSPTVCILTVPLVLTPGTYGIMFKADTWQHAYTNGANPAPGNIFSTAELTLGAGAAQNVEYVGVFSPRVVNCNIHYVPAGGGFATATPYGQGCYNQSRTFYENFAAAASFDLVPVGAMMLVRTGSSYTAIAAGAYVAPTAAATSLVLGDDAEISVPLTNPFPGLNGPTGALTVCSNGFVSPGSGNGTAFTPSVAAWHNSALERWGGWHDYNPAPAASGRVKFEEVGPIAYVTWDGVFDFGATTPNTWQLQFDTGSGNVTFAWQSISGLGNAHVVGYSAMGPSQDLGSRDISVDLPGTFSTGAIDSSPLGLAASARPVIGTSINMVTTNTANAQLGANILSLVQINPGFNLAPIGMPGCFQYVNPSVVTVGIPAAGTFSTNVTIPNNPALAGLDVYSQSGAFASGFNLLGVISSNGVQLHLDLL